MANSKFTNLPNDLVLAYSQRSIDQGTETVYYINRLGEVWTTGVRPYSTQFNPRGQRWSVYAGVGAGRDGLPAGHLVAIGNYPDPKPHVF